MRTKSDFDSLAFRRKYAGWTPAQRQNYFEEQRQRLIFERGRRAAVIQRQLEPCARRFFLYL